MTTAKKADRRAEELNSGKGGESNAAGTQAGPGVTQEAASKGDRVDTNKGTASAKAARGQPGHKTME
ncbi:hypothetical protein [Muricoccus radiodurans]|uniref:hypothetical protein n=1 Tax=Muricoccus radiodurans TaxID=2231721 RepID=UPI003CE81A6C